MQDEKNIRLNEIDDSQLEGVTGGSGMMRTMPFLCTHCQKVFNADLAKSVVTCPYCGKKHELNG